MTDDGLIFSDLDDTSDGMPKQYDNLTKDNNVPDVAGGVLWADEVNKVFWLYGGEYSTAPSTFQLWGYDTILNQWNRSDAAATASTPIQRVSYGAGTAIGGKGYYYGGYLNSLTNPLWSGDQFATSNLVILDLDTGVMSNNTGYDSTGRAEGVMVGIPASAAGMLIYFGGVSYPYANTTEVAMDMSQIMVFDIGDNKWYLQTATGNIPPNRRKFCAGATWADDQSSYNVYLYGGFGFGENITGFDDVWILSMPTFEWIKWYPDAPGASAPHGSLTCNVIDRGQMIVMGGNFTNSTDCDVPTVGAQHNLNLGQQDPTGAKWYSYLPNVTDYVVPDAIVSVAGGSSDGSATNKSPPNGFSDQALSVYFGQKATFDTRTPTRSIPSPTSTPSPTAPPKTSNTGAIAGGAVGGVVILLIIAALIWWFCMKKRKAATPVQQQPEIPQHNTGMATELNAPHESKVYPTAVITPGSHTDGYHSPYGSSPPPMAPGYGYPQQAMPQYSFPSHMQQQGYGPPQYPHSSGSPPPGGIYNPQPQGYFPPPEIQRMSPPAHELPARGMTPGTYHVQLSPHAHVAQLESISGHSEEKGRMDSRSQSTHSPTTSTSWTQSHR